MVGQLDRVAVVDQFTLHWKLVVLGQSQGGGAGEATCSKL